MSEHTPGPWKAVEHGERGSGWWSVLRGAWDVSHNGAADPGVIADARYSAMTPGENAANASLIAAAPDLLAALEQAADWFASYAAMHTEKAAFSKARVNQERADFCRAAIARARGLDGGETT